METDLKVLVLEDSELDFLLIRHTLTEAGVKFESKRVDTKGEFIDALDKYNPDVVLSDHSLAEFNSIEALKLYQRSGISAPFLVVTGNDSKEFASVCFNEGADDYVIKSELHRLPSAISGALERKKIWNERVRQGIELQAQYLEIAKAKRMMSICIAIATQMRSPLSSISGLMNLTKLSCKDKDRYNEYFEKMAHGINNLHQILNDIQDYRNII
jgi:DNA-binding NarL/FixJ family response regulator